jgi:cytochrome c-type biogenesis protein CcmF
MIPEIGHFTLILALCLALLLALVPAWGAWRGNSVAMALAPSLSIGLLVFTGISFVCLASAFLQDDFSYFIRPMFIMYNTFFDQLFSQRI